MARPVKVAVIGTGLAGLTAAYLLTSAHEPEDSGVEFEVHVFEKAPSLGMDSSSISVPVPGRDKEWRIDVPMRSFQGGYYPQLIALYKRLGVAFHQRDFSYSFSLLYPPSEVPRRKIATTMIYNGASGLAGVSMPSMLSESHRKGKGSNNLAARAFSFALFFVLTLQVLVNYLRLIILALPFMRPSHIRTMTFRQWAEYSVPTNFWARQTGWDTAWRDFTWAILVPLFSAVCTASEEDVMNHPVEEMLDYIWLTLGTHHYVATSGSKDVVSRLTSNVQHIHLSSLISGINVDAKNPQLVSIDCQTPQGTAVYTGFHHIIFATQANRAVPLLQSYLLSLPSTSRQLQPIGDQIRCLQSFLYRKTVVINHTDGTLIPDSPRDRRDLNLISLVRGESECPSEAVEDQVSSTHTMATQVLPMPTDYPAHLPQVYQTTNPIMATRKDSIISVAVLERAVLTLEAKETLEGLMEDGPRRWWQCRVGSDARLGQLQGGGRLCPGNGDEGAAARVPGVWICGSFAFGGIPLLEGCVVSARTVVEQGVLASEGVAVTGSPW